MAADVTPLRKVEARKVEPRNVQQRASEPEPLWREVLGSRLRELRRERREKLTETAGRAGISPQYLSEVERGRKEPSSEMIAALAGAFGLSLIDLTTLVIEDLRRQDRQARQTSESRQDLHPRHAQRATGPVALLVMAA
jgi:transcriptional regulator with XRE-family HTH domain